MLQFQAICSCSTGEVGWAALFVLGSGQRRSSAPSRVSWHPLITPGHQSPSSPITSLPCQPPSPLVQPPSPPIASLPHPWSSLPHPPSPASLTPGPASLTPDHRPSSPLVQPPSPPIASLPHPRSPASLTPNHQPPSPPHHQPPSPPHHQPPSPPITILMACQAPQCKVDLKWRVSCQRMLLTMFLKLVI